MITITISLSISVWFLRHPSSNTQLFLWVELDNFNNCHSEFKTTDGFIYGLTHWGRALQTTFDSTVKIKLYGDTLQSCKHTTFKDDSNSSFLRPIINMWIEKWNQKQLQKMSHGQIMVAASNLFSLSLYALKLTNLFIALGGKIGYN